MNAIAQPGLEPLFLRPRRLGLESAWYGHVPFAHWLVAAAAPRILVELGTHNGVSYSAFCEAMATYAKEGRAYAIDTWAGDEHAGHYSQDVYWNLVQFHDAHYAGFSTLLRSTFDEALPYFADGSVDLLHIDGLHTYQAVRADWDAWRPKLSARAVVLFHDTNVRERGFGVWQLWDELRQTAPHFEFLHEHGLGVLAYGAEAPPLIQELCALADPADIGAVRQRFGQLGERWIEAGEALRARTARQAVEASLAGATQEIEAAAATVTRLSGSERALMDALARADATVLETRAERERLATAEQELGAALSRTAAALEAAQAEAAALATRLGEQEAEADSLRAEAAQAGPARAELLRMRAETEAQARDLAVLRANHHAIISSSAWRATALPRQFGDRFPAVARQARRVAAVGSATLTGQLPSKLRQRRQVREDAQLLSASLLFDAAGYLVRYPEVAAAGSDPLWHYIWTGAAAGYDPHPLFDSRWYAAQHPGITGNPLAHYLRTGAAAGHDPSPVFDAAFYVAQAPEAKGNALLHFLETGAAQGLDPNPLFDTDAYWDEYLSGRDLSFDPLSHYVLQGAAAGNDPHALFDTDWYQATYKDSAGWNPLGHYLRKGKAAGHLPCLVMPDPSAPVPELRFAGPVRPLVTIIIPTYGRLFDTLRCLTSIMLHSGDATPYEVIIAEDRPNSAMARRLREIPGLRVEQNIRNLGFLRNCNRAAELATGRHILLLNNDTTVHPGWLAPLVACAEADPRVGIVGARLLNADGTIQEAGGIIHRNGWGFPYGRGQDAEAPEYGFVREVDVVIGACMLITAACWNAVGGFDERYAPAYYEEFDFAFAARDRGWRVMYQPASQVTHYDSSSYGAAERDRQSSINHAQFCRKWAAALRQQPPPDAPLFLARERPMPGHVLVVDDHVPEPDKHAGAIATFDWLRLLRGLGLRVTYKPDDQARPEPYTARLQQMGVEVLYGPIDMPRWIEQNGPHIEWVWLARPGVAEPLLDAVRLHMPGKLIYFTHDLHSLREQRRFELEGDPYHRDEARRLRRLEREIFHQSRLVLTPSPDELPFIREMAPGVQARAIPLYSVPGQPVCPPTAAAFAERHAVLFVGGYDHPPNVDAARWLVQEIMPLVWRDVPDAVLILGGSKPPQELLALAGPNIEVPGWVADLAPLYARARMSLSPLRFGAGVKGKIVESLQAGVPVVTTMIGNEGLRLTPGQQLLVGDTAEALARHAVDLLQHPDRCAALAEAGSQAVRSQFSEQAMRRALLLALDLDVCPVCGIHAPAAQPVQTCGACGAGPAERSMAAAAVQPHRSDNVYSLKAAAPLLGRVQVPQGPLLQALGRDNDADRLNLLVTAGPADAGLVVPGGRIVAPAAEAAALMAQDWSILMHDDETGVFAAMRPEPPA